MRGNEGNEMRAMRAIRQNAPRAMAEDEAEDEAEAEAQDEAEAEPEAEAEDMSRNVFHQKLGRQFFVQCWSRVNMSAKAIN